MIESAHHLTLVANPDGTLRYATPSLSEMLGYSPDEVIGVSFVDFMHEEDRPGVMRQFGDLLRRAGAVGTMRMRIREASGVWKTLYIVATNLLDNPAVNGVVVHAHDVSLHERLEVELETLRRVESLGRVAAGVAHEFRNILTGISLSVDALRAKHGLTAGPLLDSLKQAVSRGLHIVNDIREFGSGVTIERKDVDVAEWLAGAVANWSALSRHGVKVELCVTPGIGRIAVDVDRLTQVITNLILNSRDAMPGGGTITISATRLPGCGGPDRLDLSVRDTGGGIAPGDMARLFDPFFTTKRGGTGLGLAVSREIVTRHGGRILVDSKVGEGTTVTVLLPA